MYTDSDMSIVVHVHANAYAGSTEVLLSRGLCSVEICSDCWLARLALCFLAASCSWHLLIAVAKVRLLPAKELPLYHCPVQSLYNLIPNVLLSTRL